MKYLIICLLCLLTVLSPSLLQAQEASSFDWLTGPDNRPSLLASAGNRSVLEISTVSNQKTRIWLSTSFDDRPNHLDVLASADYTFRIDLGVSHLIFRPKLDLGFDTTTSPWTPKASGEGLLGISGIAQPNIRMFWYGLLGKATDGPWYWGIGVQMDLLLTTQTGLSFLVDWKGSGTRSDLPPAALFRELEYQFRGGVRITIQLAPDVSLAFGLFADYYTPKPQPELGWSIDLAWR